MDVSFTFRSEYELTELWYNIASYCTRRTLHNLCMVGNLAFVDPAQRHLFRDLVFKTIYEDVNSKRERYFARVSRAEERFAGIAASHLAKYVRSWNMDGGKIWERRNSIDPLLVFHSKAISQFIGTLPRYTKLVSLRLAFLELDTTTLTAIGALTNLKRLE